MGMSNNNTLSFTPINLTRWNRDLDRKTHAAWMKEASKIPGLLQPGENEDGLLARFPTAAEKAILAAAVAASIPAGTYFQENRDGWYREWTTGDLTIDGSPFK
jgi:hypothetical protein